MSLLLGNTLLAGVSKETKSNAHSLLDYKWTDHILSEISWLRADTFSWHSGDVYTAAYNHLVDEFTDAQAEQGTLDIQNDTIVPEYSETIGSYTIYYYLAKDGHKIVMPDQETTATNIYNESGVAWYYILDTGNHRFKLPRINPTREELIQIVRAKGNGNGLVLQDGSGAWSIRQQANHYLAPTVTDTGSPIGATASTTNAGDTNKIVGLTTDSSVSGVISDMKDSTSVYKGKNYLYFYVGEFSQTATEQTAGLNSSLFNGKIDLDGNNAGFVHIIETYHSGSNYYRIYSDGWCEQGGYEARTGTTKAVTYHKEFVDTNYNLQMSVRHTAAGTDGRPPLINSPTTTGFTASIYTSYEGFYWKACGYILLT